MSMPISYVLEVRRTLDKNKEAIQSSGDFETLTEDLMRILRRQCVTPEQFRFHIKNYVLPIVQGEVDA